MILSKVYEDAEHRLERNEITLGEFERLVDIEVIELKRGEWIDTSNKIHYKCSVCDYRAPMIWEDYEVAEWLSDFCPYCGADMREVRDE